uniref:Uncharacterized protein n=1 Tax=Arundo donax TaxID=35708 RepID=A0A0A9E7E7_ARUDO
MLDTMILSLRLSPFAPSLLDCFYCI